MTGTATVNVTSAEVELPLGALVTEGGVHFGLFSTGDSVELLLFDRVGDEGPREVLTLERHTQWSGHYWHRQVPGLRAGQVYGYRVRGPFAPQKGQRFDSDKLLLDPYARCVVAPGGRSRNADAQSGDNLARGFRGVVMDSGSYDWTGDHPPRTTLEKTVIYEVHVGSFTRHPSSGVAPGLRGTFAAVTDKIPYLRDLGVTAVEFMPVFAFDDQAAPPGRRNVWGYAPLSFFALHPGYSSPTESRDPRDEFRDMTKALHRAGIEVILDVVYNHSAEDDANGPTLSFRGLANDTYYILAPDGTYANYAGTGNVLNANSPIMRRLILDSLHYWVQEMHVDGFRFDLAAVLSRDPHGNPVASAPVLRAIESDPILKEVKLIAEAWDAAGLYELGRFACEGWAEWNGRFRDDVRRFLKSDNRTVPQLASRLGGSPDIYSVQCGGAARSVNFVTSHDGFTLNDLVSYNQKHNEANLENNRDGRDDNYSWNCGLEGPTEDASIEQLRTRQVKNFLAITLLAAGTPMLLMGDEIRRTQRGNNNGYCLDDESAWFDWRGVRSHADVHRFACELIALRMSRVSTARRLLRASTGQLQPRRIEWHGIHLSQPDWSDESHSLALRIEREGSCHVLYMMLNAYWEVLSFEVPSLEAGWMPWRRCIDTYRVSPEDISLDLDAPEVATRSVTVHPRSLVVLLARPSGPSGG